jgi:hypothetical protein
MNLILTQEISDDITSGISKLGENIKFRGDTLKLKRIIVYMDIVIIIK